LWFHQLSFKALGLRGVYKIMVAAFSPAFAGWTTGFLHLDGISAPRSLDLIVKPAYLDG